MLLTSGRVFVGRYARKDEKPQVIVEEDVCMADEMLTPYVRDLMNNFRPFTISFGESDDICLITWELDEARPYGLDGTVVRYANDGEEIAEAIGALKDPNVAVPIAMEIRLWDGRTIKGQYWAEGVEDVTTMDLRIPVEDLEDRVSELVLHSAPFITCSGNDDLVCRLRWTINELPKQAGGATRDTIDRSLAEAPE